MLNICINYDKDIFSTHEDNLVLEKEVNDNFHLPFPDSLEVKLSSGAINKIKYFYSFMIENKISNMEFYIFSTHLKEFNSFTPMKNGMPFDSNEYMDAGDYFFKTFTTDGIRIGLDKFYDKITFFFHYSNAWTEQSFAFSSSVKEIISS